MRQFQPIAALVAGFVVYGAVAACSGVDREGGHAGPGTIVGTLADAAHAAVDALANPVPTASAAPLPLQTDSVACSLDVGGYQWAEHAYPGRSAAELSFVRVVIALPQRWQAPLDRYDSHASFPGLLLVRDGSVAYQCGVKDNYFTPKSVTFVFQPQ